MLSFTFLAVGGVFVWWKVRWVLRRESVKWEMVAGKTNLARFPFVFRLARFPFQLILRVKQRGEPLLEMLFDRRLVSQEPTVGPVEPVLVDRLRRNSQQIVQGRSLIPGVGDVQLTGGLAEPGYGQNRPHHRPGNVLAIDGQKPFQQSVEMQGSPQQQTQIDIPKVPRPLHPGLSHSNLHLLGDGFDRLGGLEQWMTGFGSMIEDPGNVRPTGRVSRFQLAQIGDRLMSRTPSRANGFDQCPIGV